ncbi:MAG: MFS transporter [Miltoncostaeaceae bacterium]
MLSGARKWWMGLAMGAALGLFTLDETIVGVALDSIQDELGLSELTTHWVVNAYLLTLAAFVAAGGKLADVFGLRRVFLAGVTVFGVASLAAGFAEGSTWLIAARALQGVGGAVVVPVALAMITISFPRDQQGTALGVYGALGGLGLAMGPLLGGVLTETLSWRWIFWVNPFVVAAIAAVVIVVWKEPERRESPPLDVVGLVALVVGLSGLVLGVMQGEDWGWASPAVLGSLAVGVAALAYFTVSQLHRANPLIEVGLFRDATFSAANSSVFLGQLVKVASLVFFPVYLQQVLDLSPLEAGLAVMPAGIAGLVGGPVAGRATDRFGPRMPTLVGLAASAASLAWLGVWSTGTSYWPMLPAVIVWGFTLALVFAPPLTAVMTSVPQEQQGEASGIAGTAQMVGGTIGVAIFSALLSAGADFDVLFFGAAAASLVVLGVCWAWLDRPPRARSEVEPSPA